MKIKSNVLLTLLVLSPTIFLASQESKAEEQEIGLPLVPLPSLADYTRNDGWAGVFGFRVEYVPIFEGSEEYAVEIKPEVEIQWRSGGHTIFLEGSDIDGVEFGWRGLVQNAWLTEVGVRHETVLPTGDTEAANINGLPHRGSHIFSFFETKHSIGDGWKNWVSGRFSVGPDSFGYRGLIAVGHRFGDNSDGTGVDISFYSSFADENNINNYFGITTSDSAASGLPQTKLNGGYRSTGLKLFYRKYVMGNIQITAQAGVETYSNEIRKSAIVSDKPETSGAISVLWRF